MMSMETATNNKDNEPNAAELAGIKVEYGKLAPLNPDDLKAPEPAPRTKPTSSPGESLSVSEVWDELKQKMKESIMGSSLEGILLGMRISNLTIAALMVTIAVAQIVVSDEGFLSVLSNMFSVLYTIFFASILVAYEMRTQALDLKLRDNFGFMYGPWGRCAFLCLISIFPTGMLGIYGIIVSFIGFANAYFNYFVITKHPSFTRGVPDYVPPVSDNAAANTTTTNSFELETKTDS